MRSYPESVRSVAGGVLVMANGQRWPLSDGIVGKTPEQRLAKPDIDDMFADRYRPGPPAKPPSRDEDPGRVRFQPLFVAMYGDCTRGEVAPRLRAVSWMPRHGGGTILVTTVNGVADQLEQVIAELDRLPSAMMPYLVPNGGTYNCRPIAGTQTLSMHAFGAAIDIGVSHADYWRWAGGNAPYRNRIPQQIVEIFERHGFIWGGKWGHFDTMHFEYRPELLPASELARP